MVPHGVCSSFLWWIIGIACLTSVVFLVVFCLEDLDWNGGSIEIQDPQDSNSACICGPLCFHIWYAPWPHWKGKFMLNWTPTFQEPLQHWVYFVSLGIRSVGRTDAEAETPIFWPSDVKNLLIWKDPNSGKDWRQEEKGMTEDEMVGWHHNSMDLSLSKLWELVMDRDGMLQFMGSQRVRQLTELNWSEGLSSVLCYPVCSELFLGKIGLVPSNTCSHSLLF